MNKDSLQLIKIKKRLCIITKDFHHKVLEELKLEQKTRSFLTNSSFQKESQIKELNMYLKN